MLHRYTDIDVKCPKNMEVLMGSVYQNRYAYLRKLVEQYGSQSRLAKLMDMSAQQMSHIASDKPVRHIGDDLARRFESKLGLPIGIMDQGPGIDLSKIGEQTVEIPVLNTTVSAGAGSIQPWAEEVVHKMWLSKQWIRQRSGASSYASLAVVTARGDSMSPTFEDGDVLLVDASFSSFRTDAIYVISRDEELFVKRIQKNVDGSIEIISDNPAYSRQRIDDPVAARLLVLGKVLIAWQEKKI